MNDFRDPLHAFDFCLELMAPWVDVLPRGFVEEELFLIALSGPLIQRLDARERSLTHLRL